MFKTKPFEHQLRSLNLSRGREYFADFSEMGTGKTWVRINEAALLFGDGSIDAVLILAPKGVHTNWIVDQIPKHFPDWAAICARAWSADANKEEQRRLQDLYLLYKDRTLRVLAANWDALQTDRGVDEVESFALAFSGKLLIICDESQRIKNHSTARYKALMKRLRPHAAYRRIMSGTPVLNAPFDVWSQMMFLDDQILETTSLFAFKAEYAELLQRGHGLLDHIVKNKTKMSQEGRAVIAERIAAIQSRIAANGRGELIELSDELYCAFDDNEWETVAAKAQALKAAIGDGPGGSRAIVLRELLSIEQEVSAHIRKVSRATSDPRRMPQIVSKGKDGLPKYRNLAKLERLLAPHSFRVLKADCLDLPEKIYKQSWFAMSKPQEAAYRLMKDKARMILEDGSETSLNKLSSIMKLSQICSGFLIEPVTGKVVAMEGKTPKLALLEDRIGGVVEEEGAVIVWARFIEEIEQIVTLCRMQGWRFCTYYGMTSDEERSEAVRAFEAGEIDVFIGNQQAGGTGITLLNASKVIYYSNSFSLGDRLQSEDRAHRIGQKKSVVYEDLLCPNTIDVHITNALRNKQSIAQIITGDCSRLLE